MSKIDLPFDEEPEVCYTCGQDYENCYCWLEDEEDDLDDYEEEDSGLVQGRVSTSSEDVCTYFGSQFRTPTRRSNFTGLPS